MLQSQIPFSHSKWHKWKILKPEFWIEPKVGHLKFNKTKYQHTCMFNALCIPWNDWSWREKESLLVFQQTCKTSIEQQPTGQLLRILTKAVMVATITVTLFFTTAEGYCKPRIIAYRRRNWNYMPPNNKFVCAIPDFHRHNISSDTTHIPAESRPQPASNCREAYQICLGQHE